MNIPKGDETGAGPSSATVDCGDITTIARLSIHIKENHIAYLVGVLIAHQTGILDKVFAYGIGMC